MSLCSSIFLLFSVSCRSHSRYSEWNEIIVKDYEVNSKLVSFEKIILSFDCIYAREFFIYSDSVLILLNHRNGYKPFIEFFNLNTCELISSCFPLGNGPNEMLGALAYLNKNWLTIDDFMKRQIAFINMDSLLQNNSYKIVTKGYKNNSQYIAMYGSDSLAYINPYSFADDDLYIPNSDDQRIIVTDYNTITKTPKGHYNTFNVSGGFLVTNKEINRIVYASSNLPLFEIFDWSLNHINRVTISSQLKNQYYIDNSDDEPLQKVIFDTRIPYTFMTSCCNNDFIYLLYIGDYLEGKHEMSDFSSWIFKFDWEGKFLDSYYSDRYISSISLSSNGEIIFATTYDEDKLPVLAKFSLQ